jgi:hypothetical protein
MMKATFFLGIFILILASCTTVSFQGLQMQGEIRPYTIVGEFQRTITDYGSLGVAGGGTLVSYGNPDKEIAAIIQEEIINYSGDAAINIELKYSAGFINIILATFTLSLLSNSTITLRGTVIKYID